MKRTRPLGAMLIVVALCGRSALAGEAVRVRVETSAVSAGFEESLHTFIVAEPLAVRGPSEGMVRDRVMARARIGETQELILPPGAFVISAYAEGYWGSSVEIVLPGLQDITLKLWPAGFAHGTASWKGKRLPELRMKFTPSDADDSEPFGEVRCTLSGGEFACPLPLGKFDIRFRSPGFMGIYFWDVTVGAGPPVAFGDLLFEKGSSLVGFVKTEAATQGDVKDAVVQLQTMDGEPVEKSTSGRKRAVVASPNYRGFWQMNAVPPGEYRVVASAPGFDEVRAIVHVLPEKETTYGAPLVLSRPREFEIYVDPPTDPNGEQWSLRLFRNTFGEQAEPISATTAGDGLFTAALRQGRYRLILASPSIGNVHTDEFDFSLDSDPLQLTLNYIQVVGRLRLGRKPLAGTLSFGGTSGAVSVHMDADLSGRFEGLLPREGVWLVAINTTQPRITRTLSNIVVRENGSGIAVVNIDLPNTKLSGVVRDERGNPVVHANVTAFRRGVIERPEAHLSDAEGEFEFRALPEDTYTLSATANHPLHGALESDPITVDLSEASVGPSSYTIHLYGARRVHGRVFSTLGPIPNAHILGIPEDGVGFAPQADSDIDGRFQLDVRRRTQQLNILASASGYSLRLLTVRPSSPTSPLEIPLITTGGTIIVEITESTDSAPAFPFGRFLLLREDSWTPLTALHTWARMNGGGHQGARMVIPQMEPGSYRLCSVDSANGVVRAGENCISGMLFPDDELVFAVN